MTNTILDLTDLWNSAQSLASGGIVIETGEWDYVVVQPVGVAGASPSIAIQASSDMGDVRTYTPGTTSPGLYPSTGGTGAAGVPAKGDYYYILSDGYLGTQFVYEGQTVQANTNTPGQTAANWNILSIRQYSSDFFAQNFSTLTITNLGTNTGTTAITASGNYKFQNPVGSYIKITNNGTTTVTKLLLSMSKIV